jgi:spore germination protein KC
MKHRSFMIVFSMLTILCLSGCWDTTELQDLSIVSGIGIDKGGDNVDNKYRTTVQIVNPSQVSGAQQGGKFQASAVTSYSATGSSLKEAFLKVSLKAPNELFFPHVQIMIISEELAKEGIRDLFDVIERDSSFRVLFPVVIVRGNTAENALKITTPLQAIPTGKMVASLESSEKIWGEYLITRADEVISKLKKGNLSITGIQINGDVEKGKVSTNIQQISPDASIETRGLAFFKDGKLEKWLEKDEAHGVTWINNELKRTVTTLDCKKKKEAITVEVIASKTKINVEIENQKPVINISVFSEGVVSEIHCSIDLSKNKTIEELEEKLNKEIKEEIMASVKAVQEGKSDIFDFGEYVNIADKKLWKEIENKWDEEIFPETEVKVKVQAAIRRTGLRVNQYIE